MRLPKDVCDAALCGRLNKAMYGCRDAAQCWEMEITDFFTSCGFTPGVGGPVLFVNLVRDLRVSIHGDDITALGRDSDLLWLKEALETRYELKYGGMLGPDSGDVQDATILNRLIHFGKDETMKQTRDMFRFWFVSSVSKMPKMLPPLESHESMIPNVHC